MPEPYDILGVKAGASDAAIKAAFRSAAKRCHPDMNSGDRTGERRLRRLISARDLLLGRGRRFSYRKRAGHALRLGAGRRRRAPLIAGAFTTAGFLLLLMAHLSAPVSPGSAPFQTSVIEDNIPIPDAESAELKGIRDSRELAGAEPAEPRKVVTDGAARDKTTAPSPASRHHTPRPKSAVTEAAAAVTKTWRRLASSLGAP
jgi:curved DNA-binding protein CbpA